MKHIFNIILYFFFRRTSFESKLLKYGFLFASPRCITWIIKPILPENKLLSLIEIEYSTLNTTSFFVGLGLILTSIFLHIRNGNLLKNKEHLGLYQSYLSNNLEQGFKSLINKKAKGSAHITKINITDLVNNYILTSPSEALRKVEGGIQKFISNVNDSNNEPILYYGGLMAVPFSFYTGMELDDRYPINVLDYDRTEQKWKEIDRVLLSDYPNILIENNGNYQGESVIVASISYLINEQEVEQQFSGIPISRIQVGNIDKDNHWDIEFQKELQNEFLDLVKKLGASGCHTIHLILAAQNSVSFNLGRCYDNRNLPSVIVYQYEKGNEIKYPWGLKMKTSGIDKAEIIHN